MVSKISRNAWSQYETLLPKDLEVGAPMFPKTLPRQGQVIGPFDYILPDVLLADLKVWLRKRGERHLFYFLTEAWE